MKHSTLGKHPLEFHSTLAGLALCLVSSVALAAPGYVTDSPSDLVHGGFGECVRTGFWDDSMNTPACDPELAARLEAERLEAERLAAEAAARAAAIKPAAARLISVSDSGNVGFGFDRHDLNDIAAGELSRVTEEVNRYSRIERIEIRGHTDSTGPAEYNQALSERRARSVSEALSAAGLPADVMTVEGVGEGEPVADNASREGRAQNRRVDIHIVGQRAE